MASGAHPRRTAAFGEIQSACRDSCSRPGVRCLRRQPSPRACSHCAASPAKATLSRPECEHSARASNSAVSTRYGETAPAIEQQQSRPRCCICAGPAALEPRRHCCSHGPSHLAGSVGAYPRCCFWSTPRLSGSLRLSSQSATAGHSLARPGIDGLDSFFLRFATLMLRVLGGQRRCFAASAPTGTVAVTRVALSPRTVTR